MSRRCDAIATRLGASSTVCTGASLQAQVHVSHLETSGELILFRVLLLPTAASLYSLHIFACSLRTASFPSRPELLAELV